MKWQKHKRNSNILLGWGKNVEPESETWKCFKVQEKIVLIIIIRKLTNIHEYVHISIIQRKVNHKIMKYSDEYQVSKLSD